ncbi:aldehyde dehydrogenase family protein [Klebsiella pneumoniae]
MSVFHSDLFRQQALIAGSWRDAADGTTLAVSNPSTGATLGQIPNMGRAEAQQAVDAAAAALPDWRALTAAQRAALLKNWHRLILENKTALAQIMTAEQGKPLAEAEGEIAYAASFIEWFAEQGKRANGEIIPSPGADKRLMVIRQGVGVCAAITPWNFPAAMITRKAGPALAAGCTMVIKPANETPFTALAMAELANQAGIPQGVINVVTGQSREIGAVFTADAGRKVQSLLDDAMSRGATLLTGGKAHPLGGNFFTPTVIGDVQPGSLLLQEEIFGPVAALVKFDDEQQVIEQANNTIYGLASYFYSNDAARIWRVSEQLEYGMVGINTGLISNEVAPFGGVKQSGLGREGSEHGIEDYLEMKYLCQGL